MSFCRLVSALFSLSLCVACASPTGPRDTAGWFEARGADLMDTIGLRFAFGAGLGAYVRVTEYGQLGFMLRGPAERSIPKPKDIELRSVPCFMFGTIGRYGGAWFDSTREIMLPGWSSRDEDVLQIEREVIAGFVSRHGRRDNWRGALGLGVHVVLVGFEAEVRPFEILDLLGGLLGYDPSGDDVPVDSSEDSEAET